MRLFAIVLLIAASSGTPNSVPEKPQAYPKTQAAAKQASANASPYSVENGDRVDEQTLQGWKTWRALACERCHGASQEGLVGPPLVESMKKLTKEEFHTTLMKGRPEKGMPPFESSAMVTRNWEGLYAYLKGRADGRIQAGRLQPLEQPR